MEGKTGCFKALPSSLIFEIERLCKSRGRCVSDISEIRLRSFGKSSIKLSGEKINLYKEVRQEDVEACLLNICKGSLYSYRDSIAEGYVTCEGGVRVGISGTARYDGGKLVGIGDISSLIFRIPTGKSDVYEELRQAWSISKSGMLIYSPPGIGKTTALRSLVGYIGGICSEEVAVIDERCEFLSSDYKNLSVDILRGYKRSLGMQIALRSMSPSVMVIDEIGREDESRALLDSVNSGVRILATAHAGSYDELLKRKCLAPLFMAEVFDVAVGLFIEGGRRVAKTEELVH